LIVAGLDNRSKAAFARIMAKHPKRPRDFNQAAKLVVDIATGDRDDPESAPPESAKTVKPRQARATSSIKSKAAK
jgi:hypothetical protein